MKMDDSISRQATLEALLDKGQHSRRYKLGDIWELNFDEIREVINALPQADPQWIPISKGLPKIGEWVLCQCRAGIMDVLRLTEDGFWEKNHPYTVYMSGFVIAWMPLPEPYKEERDAVKRHDGNCL